MSAEVMILVTTAVLAVVAIGAAVVAVRAVRQLSRSAAVPAAASESVPVPVDRPTPVATHAGVVVRGTDVTDVDAAPTAVPRELEHRVVEGRLVVPPTQHQVVQAAMGRPGVRLSILAHGVAHALRAESRDRIAALMRREFRRRRRERLQAGRRAVRAAKPSPSDRTAP
jgi:hypothetical protein